MQQNVCSVYSLEKNENISHEFVHAIDHDKRTDKLTNQLRTCPLSDKNKKKLLCLRIFNYAFSVISGFRMFFRCSHFGFEFALRNIINILTELQKNNTDMRLESGSILILLDLEFKFSLACVLNLIRKKLTKFQYKQISYFKCANRPNIHL